MRAILVLNAGSSSIKFAVFRGETTALTGSVEEIGGAGATVRVGGIAAARLVADHDAALGEVIGAMEANGLELGDISAAAHRVVHGGAHLVAPRLVDDGVIAEIERCNPLAPLHNPHNLAAIKLFRARAPALPQVACFDTAFHATNPDVATRYALPRAVEALGIRRYGFHGLSYASLTRRLPDLTGGSLPSRLLACHLGNGASLCAIKDGASVATTMGYSPLEGLTMGTRTGGIDGNAVLRLVAEEGAERASAILNRESGLLGLSGTSSDMRALSKGGDAARFAIDHFNYWVVRHAGSMVAAMGGLDAIAFTGGIGENSAPVRAAVVGGLNFLGATLDTAANAAKAQRLHTPESPVGVYIVPAEEERMIATYAEEVLQAGA